MNSTLNYTAESKARLATESIARYAVYYLTRKEELASLLSQTSITLTSSLREVLDQMLDDLTEQNIGFTTFLKQLKVDEDNCSTCLYNVFNEMLNDRRFNWGRVVTMLCFSGCMAKYLLDRGHSANMVDKIVRACSDFFCCELSEWIKDQGGWVGLENHFRQQQKQTPLVWSGWHSLFQKGIDAVTSAVLVR